MALGSADLSLRANYDESLETLNDILALEPNQWLDPIQIDWVRQLPSVTALFIIKILVCLLANYREWQNQWDMLSSL